MCAGQSMGGRGLNSAPVFRAARSYLRFPFWYVFRSQTPGPLPFSSMTSTPAASNAQPRHRAQVRDCNCADDRHRAGGGGLRSQPYTDQDEVPLDRAGRPAFFSTPRSVARRSPARMVSGPNEPARARRHAHCRCATAQSCSARCPLNTSAACRSVHCSAHWACVSSSR
jgi:hypothetical protein